MEHIFYFDVLRATAILCVALIIIVISAVFIIDKIIKEKTIEEIKKGNNVILDYGLWEKETRKKYYDWAKKITPDVVFHAVQCDISLAKKRALERTKKHSEEFYIDEDIFNDRLKRFEPMTNEEGFPVIFYKTDNE
mgnify:CR=1 FL=1